MTQGGGAEREAGARPTRLRGALPAGTLTAALGILCFSFTFPATRLADPDFGGTIVGLGRALVAALLAIGYLALTRGPRPRGRQWARVAVAGAGIVVGFPLLTALALRHVTAAHTAVIVGLLPAATALIGALRGGERPSPAFWLAAVAGLVAVLAFAVIQGAGGPTGNDGLVIVAVFVCAIGYAEGGLLARELGGARTICWALVVAAPVAAPIAIVTALHHGLHAGPDAWLGFAYVSIFSMFLGFFAWYHGLARGGIARMSQLQLAQPLLTLGWSAALLGERVTPVTLVAALAVLACVAATQRARVARYPSPEGAPPPGASIPPSPGAGEVGVAAGAAAGSAAAGGRGAGAAPLPSPR
jgi:drug/metabolite transporter (DMT)-like permease